MHRVDSDGVCWLWTGAISGKGHGRFQVGDTYLDTPDRPHRRRLGAGLAALFRPGRYLLTTEAWSTHRASFCGLVGKSPDPAVALAAVTDELAGALAELEQVLAAGDGTVRLDDAGELVISPLTAEDTPAEAVAQEGCHEGNRTSLGPVRGWSVFRRCRRQ